MRSSSAAYELNLTHWPVVYSPPLAGTPDRAGVDSFYRELEKVVARRQRFAYVHDLRGASHIGSDRRKRFLRFVEKERARLQRQVAGVAVVVDSRVLETFVSVITWPLSRVVPVKVFRGDPGAAIVWARAIVASEPRGAESFDPFADSGEYRRVVDPTRRSDES